MKITIIGFKAALIACIIFILSSCGGRDNTKAVSQAQIDTPGTTIVTGYKPGLGEFMLGIQVHHAKIWFAGKNQNWPLADFETGEIRETIAAVKTYCTDRPEVKSLPIIYPGLDSLSNAIKAKSLKRFNSAFVTLTNLCNSCHRATNHSFNVIKIPDNPPYSNQNYNVK